MWFITYVCTETHRCLFLLFFFLLCFRCKLLSAVFIVVYLECVWRQRSSGQAAAGIVGKSTPLTRLPWRPNTTWKRTRKENYSNMNVWLSPVQHCCFLTWLQVALAVKTLLDKKKNMYSFRFSATWRHQSCFKRNVFLLCLKLKPTIHITNLLDSIPAGGRIFQKPVCLPGCVLTAHWLCLSERERERERQRNREREILATLFCIARIAVGYNRLQK